MDQSPSLSSAGTLSAPTSPRNEIKNRCTCGKLILNIDNSQLKKPKTAKPVHERLYESRVEIEMNRRKLTTVVRAREARDCTYLPRTNQLQEFMRTTSSLSTLEGREKKVEFARKQYLMGRLCDDCFKQIEVGTGTYVLENMLGNEDLPQSDWVSLKNMSFPDEIFVDTPRSPNTNFLKRRPSNGSKRLKKQLRSSRHKSMLPLTPLLGDSIVEVDEGNNSGGEAAQRMPTTPRTPKGYTSDVSDDWGLGRSFSEDAETYCDGACLVFNVTAASSSDMDSVKAVSSKRERVGGNHEEQQTSNLPGDIAQFDSTDDVLLNDLLADDFDSARKGVGAKSAVAGHEPDKTNSPNKNKETLATRPIQQVTGVNNDIAGNPVKQSARLAERKRPTRLREPSAGRLSGGVPVSRKTDTSIPKRTEVGLPSPVTQGEQATEGKVGTVESAMSDKGSSPQASTGASDSADGKRRTAEEAPFDEVIADKPLVVIAVAAAKGSRPNKHTGLPQYSEQPNSPDKRLLNDTEGGDHANSGRGTHKKEKPGAHPIQGKSRAVVGSRPPATQAKYIVKNVVVAKVSRAASSPQASVVATSPSGGEKPGPKGNLSRTAIGKGLVVATKKQGVVEGRSAKASPKKGADPGEKVSRQNERSGQVAPELLKDLEQPGSSGELLLDGTPSGGIGPNTQRGVPVSGPEKATNVGKNGVAPAATRSTPNEAKASVGPPSPATQAKYVVKSVVVLNVSRAASSPRSTPTSPAGVDKVGTQGNIPHKVTGDNPVVAIAKPDAEKPVGVTEPSDKVLQKGGSLAGEIQNGRVGQVASELLEGLAQSDSSGGLLFDDLSGDDTSSDADDGGHAKRAVPTDAQEKVAPVGEKKEMLPTPPSSQEVTPTKDVDVGPAEHSAALVEPTSANPVGEKPSIESRELDIAQLLDDQPASPHADTTAPATVMEPPSPMTQAATVADGVVGMIEPAIVGSAPSLQIHTEAIDSAGKEEAVPQEEEPGVVVGENLVADTKEIVAGGEIVDAVKSGPSHEASLEKGVGSAGSVPDGSREFTADTTVDEEENQGGFEAFIATSVPLAVVVSEDDVADSDEDTADYSTKDGADGDHAKQDPSGPTKDLPQEDLLGAFAQDLSAVTATALGLVSTAIGGDALGVMGTSAKESGGAKPTEPPTEHDGQQDTGASPDYSWPVVKEIVASIDAISASAVGLMMVGEGRPEGEPNAATESSSAKLVGPGVASAGTNIGLSAPDPQKGREMEGKTDAVQHGIEGTTGVEHEEESATEMVTNTDLTPIPLPTLQASKKDDSPVQDGNSTSPMAVVDEESRTMDIGEADQNNGNGNGGVTKDGATVDGIEKTKGTRQSLKVVVAGESTGQGPVSSPLNQRRLSPAKSRAMSIFQDDEASMETREQSLEERVANAAYHRCGDSSVHCTANDAQDLSLTLDHIKDAAKSPTISPSSATSQNDTIPTFVEIKTSKSGSNEPDISPDAVGCPGMMDCIADTYNRICGRDELDEKVERITL